MTGLVVTSVALGLGINSIANVSFSVALIWTFLFLPHLATVPSPLSPSFSFVLAVVQWTGVGVFIGALTRGKSVAHTLILTSITVIIVAALVHAIIRALGYEILVDGP
jgi:hypothetical protein